MKRKRAEKEENFMNLLSIICNDEFKLDMLSGIDQTTAA